MDKLKKQHEILIERYCELADAYTLQQNHFEFGNRAGTVGTPRRGERDVPLSARAKGEAIISLRMENNVSKSTITRLSKELDSEIMKRVSADSEVVRLTSLLNKFRKSKVETSPSTSSSFGISPVPNLLDLLGFAKSVNLSLDRINKICSELGDAGNINISSCLGRIGEIQILAGKISSEFKYKFPAKRFSVPSQDTTVLCQSNTN